MGKLAGWTALTMRMRLSPRCECLRTCYLSMDFPIGRSHVNNIINLRLHSRVRQGVLEKGIGRLELVEQEPHIGRRKEELGRLAYLLESMATMQLAAARLRVRVQVGEPLTCFAIRGQICQTNYGRVKQALDHSGERP